MKDITTADEGVGAEVAAARAHGDSVVHLALHRGSTLCGKPLRLKPPRRSFREAGCPDCLRRALGAGQIAARENDRAWINLLRV